MQLMVRSKLSRVAVPGPPGERGAAPAGRDQSVVACDIFLAISFQKTKTQKSSFKDKQTTK